MRQFTKHFIFFSSLTLNCIVASARSGGAGGGHGHSSGGSYGNSGGGGDFLFDIIFSVLFRSGPVGWILIGFLIFLYFRYQNGFKRAAQGPEENSEISVAEMKFFDGENTDEFKKKVVTAFLTIQKSWSEKRLDLMRRFITDGVYQRYHAQIIMMNILKETNIVADVEVQNIQIVKTSVESNYDCVDVAITASASDMFVSESNPELNSPGGRETFVEYWSFIRRHDYKRGSDIFHSELCPKCSAPLTSKLVETAKCPYCGTYLNSGEYDWVLCEIAQAEDYGLPIIEKLDVTLPADFSSHVLEDRTTNAFMQILIAQLTNNTNALQRFCTPKAFEFFKKSKPPTPIAYNRLYTQAVEILKTQLNGAELRAYVAIKFAFSIILLGEHRASSQTEEDLDSDVKVLVMTRFINSEKALGSVYANSCPKCGAGQPDSLSPICAFCRAPLNDAHLDWIVDDMLNLNEYQNLVQP